MAQNDRPISSKAGAVGRFLASLTVGKFGFGLLVVGTLLFLTALFDVLDLRRSQEELLARAGGVLFVQ